MPERSSKKDANETAFDIVRKATTSDDDPAEAASNALDDEQTRKEFMREMGRRGGRKGGAARANSLTPEERSEIARNAAKKRWEKRPE